MNTGFLRHIWTQATILGRAGKSNTATKFWYNIEEKETREENSVNLNDFDWRKIQEEDVNIVRIPKNKHTDEYLNAKQEELQRLEDFGAYKEENDKEKTCISITWLLTNKEGQKKARFVARGFEE